MRPHVEIVQQSDLCWHDAELPKGSGRVAQRNLCYDEENGAASTKLRFDSDWNREGGFHEADTEWYILKGEVRLGNHVLREGCYWRAPAGLRVPGHVCPRRHRSTALPGIWRLGLYGLRQSPIGSHSPGRQYGVQEAGQTHHHGFQQDDVDAQYFRGRYPVGADVKDALSGSAQRRRHHQGLCHDSMLGPARLVRYQAGSSPGVRRGLHDRRQHGLQLRPHGSWDLFLPSQPRSSTVTSRLVKKRARAGSSVSTDIW